MHAAEEFDACLKQRLNLRFEPVLLQSILKSFDDTGNGKIDFRKFCENVLGSTQRTETSLTLGQIPGTSHHVSADGGELMCCEAAINLLLDLMAFRSGCGLSEITCVSGNNDMMVRRKIRMSLKPLRASFKDLVDGQPSIHFVATAGKHRFEDLKWNIVALQGKVVFRKRIWRGFCHVMTST